MEANLKLWEDMKAGNEKGLECAARFRMVGPVQLDHMKPKLNPPGRCRITLRNQN